MRSYLITFLAAAAVPLGACNLYFSGGDDPDPCEFGGGDTLNDSQEAPTMVSELRNPLTGQCESFWGGGGGGGPWPCNDACGPCPGGDLQEEEPGGAQAPIPTWGVCIGMCSGLEEATCLATDACRGIYTGDGFQECWETDTDVAQKIVVNCEGLEAQDCSRYDYCSALHASSCDPMTGGAEESDAPAFTCAVENFVSCFPETTEEDGCYDNNDCGEGYACNASEICLPPPTDAEGDKCPVEICGIPQPCYGFCVRDVDPEECFGEVLCDALPPTCPTGTVPGVANGCWTGNCLPQSICTPPNPGECDAPLNCADPVVPDCPENTVPGIADGCWTGYCIPLSSCPTMDCSEIQNEAMCVERNDCDALYAGIECECTPEGCECSEWQFDSCETGPKLPPAPGI